MIGQRNSLLQKKQNEQGDRKMFDFGCPYHLAHLWAGNSAKDLQMLKILLLT